MHTFLHQFFFYLITILQLLSVSFCLKLTVVRIVGIFSFRSWRVQQITKFQISTTPSPLPTPPPFSPPHPPPLPFLPDVDPILFPLCRNVGKKWEGSQEMSNKWNQFGFSLLCDKHFLLVIDLQNSVLDLWRSIPS